jgi:hypothetical protein
MATKTKPAAKAQSVSSTAASSLAATSNSGTAVSTTPAPSVAPKGGFILNLLQLMQGLQKLLPDGSSLGTVDGPLTKSDMVTQLQSWIALYEAISPQETALANARSAYKAELPDARAYFAQVKLALQAFYSPTNPTLAQFGIKPRGPRAKSALKTAAKVVRTLQTRRIRGTLGPKARKEAPKSGPVTLGNTSGTSPASTPGQPAAVAKPTTQG